MPACTKGQVDERQKAFMLEIETSVPPTASKIESVVEAACVAEGLRLTLKDTLAKYPGCVHRHFKKGVQIGTLEVTWWETQPRLWFSVQAGRKGEWMEAALPRLKRALEKAMAHKTR